MNDKLMKVLLIEDNPGDTRLIKEILFEEKNKYLRLEHVDNLKSGLEMLGDETITVVLLDLNLPDSMGLETFKKLHEGFPDTPIVILSGHSDSSIALKAVELGAQDYLEKDQVYSNILYKALQYAIERQKLLLRLEISEYQRTRELEYSSLQKLSESSMTLTSSIYGMVSLRKSYPSLFNELLEEYKYLLDRALENQILRRKSDVSEKLLLVSRKLGPVLAKPRDVIDIHIIALKEKCNSVPPQKAQGYLDVGRIMVLELMGYLVSYYRTYYFPRADNMSPENKKEKE